jgi:hypothetical protein
VAERRSVLGSHSALPRGGDAVLHAGVEVFQVDERRKGFSDREERGRCKDGMSRMIWWNESG